MNNEIEKISLQEIGNRKEVSTMERATRISGKEMTWAILDSLHAESARQTGERVLSPYAQMKQLQRNGDAVEGWYPTDQLHVYDFATNETQKVPVESQRVTLGRQVFTVYKRSG